MKKVLIITYYWPPSGGAGVQRWLKFTKYLRDFGWEPVIYTPENPEAPAIDHSLEKDIPAGITVIKTPIREPYAIYKRFVGRKKDDSIKSGFLSEKKNPGLAEKISVWIRGNLFIPDARMLWIKPSVRFLTKYIAENPVDAMVSTGPPHSMHLIALGVKKAFQIPWLADFRDPWTNIDFYDKLMLTKKSDKKQHQLEMEVLKTADQVCLVSQNMKTDFQNVYSRNYHVITNGFDPDDFVVKQELPEDKFSLVHIGSLVPSRNPENLWKSLSELISEVETFSHHLIVRLIGQVDISVKNDIKRFGLTDYTEFISYLPHEEVIKHQQLSAVLLLLINQTPNACMVVTGKLFEYIQSGRPVLCIGPPTGDAAEIIRDTATGKVFNYDDRNGLKQQLYTYFRDYIEGKLKVSPKNPERYSRKKLTEDLASILERISD